MQLPSAPGSPIGSVSQIAPSYESFLQARLLLHELYKRRSYSDSEIQKEFESVTPEKRARLSSPNNSDRNLSSLQKSSIVENISSAISSAKYNAQTVYLPVFTKPDSPINLKQPIQSDTIVKRGRLIPKPLRLPIAHNSGSLESDISTPQDSPLDLSIKSISPKTITDRFVSIITESLSSSSSPSSITSSMTLNAIPLSPINLSNSTADVKSESSSPRTPHHHTSQLHTHLFDIPFTATSSSTPATPTSATSTTSSKSEVTGRTKSSAQNTKYSPHIKDHLHNQLHAHHEPLETIKIPFTTVPQRSNYQVQNHNTNLNKTEYVCPICSQVFSLHDRLAKHIASRHRNRPTESTGKSYVCDVCKRSFARSDMLTRHMRLHTGIKPYTCRICGQVFSRSDHLSTHQRTHTGEKPYKCPQCPYAACRRDMITRHMRTHARYELPDSSSTYKDLNESEKK